MIDLVHKLPALDEKLISLLESLTAEDWNKQTVAKLWKVKDVAAHLLDGNIRLVSGLRDHHEAENPTINSYQDLVDYLNRLNAEWVLAMKRVSPEMLTYLLKLTGKPYYEFYATLDPMGISKYPVSWAGENESKNWMHIAREYTEKFLHQQQIRDAVGKPGIMTKEYFHPFLNVCMQALPHTLRNTTTGIGDTIKMNISGDVGGTWMVRYDGHQWLLITDVIAQATTEIEIDAEASWKLFSKSLRPDDLRDKISIKGNLDLGEAAIHMVSFMA